MKSILNSRKHQFANLLISPTRQAPGLWQFANYSIRKFPVLIVFIQTTISMVSTNSFSQEIQWQKTIGGSGNDYLVFMDKTLDGGFILGCQSMSNISCDKTEDCQGWIDYWIVKTDSAGNIQWQNTIGGDYNDNLTCLHQTSDLGYIVGGWSSSNISGDKLEANQNGDFWVVKLDSNGNIQWQNTIGGSNGDVLSYLEQTRDNGYILGGYSNSNISGDKTENSIYILPNTYSSDYWIVKIDSMGNLQWQNTIGGRDADLMNVVHQTHDGGFLLAGNSISNGFGDKTEFCLGGWDYWIVKTDSIGNIQWQNTIGGNGDDYLYTAELTSDGGFIIGGGHFQIYQAIKQQIVME